jgi:tRNA threonylcarbamoyladenosine biosynthesis protein TsaB
MILALSTSTLQFGLALLEEDGNVLAEYFLSRGKGHFGGLMPALDFLLNSSKSKIRDINCISVATGPGSFTGLRVGLSTAKGLSHGLDVPIIGVPSLEALAYQLSYSGFPVIPVLDSRKYEFFAARFIWDDDHALVRNREDVCLKVEDLSSLCKEPTLFVGNDFAGQGSLIKERLGPRAILAPAHLWNLRASAVGLLGLKRFHDHDFDDSQQLSPIYMRPPDIRPNPSPVTADKS